MAYYKIIIKTSAKKALYKLPKKDLQRVLKLIEGLSINPRPHGCKKLTGREEYRIRQGNYRVVYAIKNKQLVVYVVNIAHRRNVYHTHS